MQKAQATGDERQPVEVSRSQVGVWRICFTLWNLLALPRAGCCRDRRGRSPTSTRGEADALP